MDLQTDIGSIWEFAHFQAFRVFDFFLNLAVLFEYLFVNPFTLLLHSCVKAGTLTPSDTLRANTGSESVSERLGFTVQ